MSQRLRLLFAIAWRNLARNNRRTLIAGSGIALGVGMGIAGFGVMDGMSYDMVRSITDVQLGHVQVHEPGFSSRPKLELAFDDAESRTHAAEQTPGVEAASPRVLGWALASSAKHSAGVQLLGVDPEREAALTRLDQRVVRGRYLPRAATKWPPAQSLSAEERELDRSLTEQSVESAAAEIDALDSGSTEPADGATSAPAMRAESGGVAARTRQLLEQIAPKPSSPPPLALGAKLARKLHAEPGTLVSLMAQDLDGDPVNVEFRVVGVLHTGDPALDGIRAVAHVADVRRLLGLGDRAHELAIRVHDPSDVEPVTRALARDAAFGDLEVKSWQQLRPDVVSMIQTNSVLTAMLIGIIVAAAAIGVANTILMSVFERRRELGMLKAVGMRPAFVVLMVSAETLLLSIAASLVGLGLGLGLDFVLERHGIPLGQLEGFSLAGASIPPVLHASTTPQGVLVPLGCMFVMAMLAALWPAYLAARTQPVVAMRDR